MRHGYFLYLLTNKYTSPYSERLDRVLITDLPGQQDRVLHGCFYSEVGGKNYGTEKEKRKKRKEY